MISLIGCEGSVDLGDFEVAAPPPAPTFVITTEPFDVAQSGDFVVLDDGVEDAEATGTVTADVVGDAVGALAFSGDKLLHVPSPDRRDQFIYFLMIDRFNNADGSNDDFDSGEFRPDSNAGYSGGDLQGIIDKIDYIKGLGATAIGITPPARTSGGIRWPTSAATTATGRGTRRRSTSTTAA